jgi:hypothetical protein
MAPGSEGVPMSRIAVFAGVLAVTVVVAAPAGAVNVGSWRACGGEPFVRVHNITCALGKKVARYGFRPGTLRTWIGGFHCTRQRNAENVIWLYTCLRHHGHDGVFFPDPTAGLSSAVTSCQPANVATPGPVTGRTGRLTASRQSGI